MHRNIKLLLAASTLIHSGAALMAPIYAIFLTTLNGTVLEAGLAVGIYTLLRGVLYLNFANIKPDVISHRSMMMTGYTLMGLVYLFYPSVSAVWHVYILQVFLAFSESIITPSWSATIAVSLEEGSERKTYSNFYGYRSLFEGTAAIVGGYIALKLGFTVIFFTMTALAFASSAVVYFIDRSDESPPEPAG